MDLQGPEYSDFKDPIMIFSGSRDSNQVPETLKNN